jgi:hypothetical protein
MTSGEAAQALDEKTRNVAEHTLSATFQFTVLFCIVLWILTIVLRLALMDRKCQDPHSRRYTMGCSSKFNRRERHLDHGCYDSNDCRGWSLQGLAP